MNIFEFRNSKAGMTLVEMVISLAILSVLVTSSMGMIISSNNMFISTSAASLDKQVGNSVFSLLENAVKYSTHLTIHKADYDVSKVSTSNQALYIKYSDNTKKYGYLNLKQKNVAADSNKDGIYAQGFYSNRSVQYSVTKTVGSSKCVDLRVTVFRNGEAVYTRKATVKCLNLGLDTISDNPNVIVEDLDCGEYNQCLDFSNNELIIAGGSDAYTIEYKVGEYINQYNEIQNAYVKDLNAATTAFNNAVSGTKNVTGSRMLQTAYKNAADKLTKIIYGDSSKPTEYSYDENNIQNCVNLRAYYQEKIKKLLKFEPTAAGFTKGSFSTPEIKSSSNASKFFKVNIHTGDEFYGVVATKEELYAGYMYNYFDKNGDLEITKNEFPSFDDPDTFLKNTSIQSYLNNSTATLGDNTKSENKMVILAYFRDNVDDHDVTTNSEYKKLISSTTDTAYATSGTGTGTISLVKRGSDNHYVTTKIDNYDHTNDKFIDRTTMYVVSDYVGVTVYKNYYSITTTKESAATDTLYGGIATVARRQGQPAKKTGVRDYYFDADNFYSILKTKLGATEITTSNANINAEKHENLDYYYYDATLTPKVNLTEGWYLYHHMWNAHDMYVFFYLKAADYTSEVDADGNIKTLATKTPTTSENNVAVVAGSDIHIGDSLYATGTDTDNTINTKDKGFWYQQGLYETIDNGDLYAINYTKKSYTAHNFNDYVVYAVDWNSWFVKNPTGLINKVMTNTVSWFQNILGRTSNADITSINPANAYQSLGNIGTFTVNKASTTAGSFNLATCIYSPATATWYYLPSTSTSFSGSTSKLSFTSFKDKPTPLDVEIGNGKTWNNSTAMMYDINGNKLSSTGLWGLIDTTADQKWVSLPTGGSTDVNLVANLKDLTLTDVKSAKKVLLVYTYSDFTFFSDTYSYTIHPTKSSSKIDCSTSDTGATIEITLLYTKDGNEVTRNIANGAYIAWPSDCDNMNLVVKVISTKRDNANNEKKYYSTYNFKIV